MLQQEFQIFRASLIFFTRIPGIAWEGQPQESFSKASRYFPLVGWFVGAIGAGAFWAGNLLFPLPLAVLLSMTATIVFTGALHEDGLADSCDGFVGGWTREQILAIMKDSYIGVFGVIGLILILAAKLLVLLSCPPLLLPLILISGHSLSRFASISFLYTHDYVREESSSKAKSVVRRMSLFELLFTCIIGVFPFFMMSLMTSQWYMFGCGLLLVGLFRWGLGLYFSYRIQGYTGDCLGAAQQITEVTFYLTLVAMIRVMQ